MSKMLDLTAGLKPINMAQAMQAFEWHDLSRYEIIAPTVAKPFGTRNGWRAAIHINPSNTVYSNVKFETEQAANEAAARKIEEMKGNRK